MHTDNAVYMLRDTQMLAGTQTQHTHTQSEGGIHVKLQICHLSGHPVHWV